MPIALILVDALSAAYVSSSTLPTITNLTAHGFNGPLENMYAYRGIETTLFTGKSPVEHGIWGEFRPAPEAQRQESWRDYVTQHLLALGDVLPSDRLRLDARYVTLRLLQRKRFLPMGNLIPPALIWSFKSNNERPIWELGSQGAIPTLFDELAAANRSFATVVYPTIKRDRDILGYVEAQLQRRPLPDVWYIKFSELDALGHRFGPNTDALRPALQALDAQLAALVKTLRKAYAGDDLQIIILSDHGMSRVDRVIDVRPLLKQINLLPGRDFLHFLDSTTIRFWSKNSTIRAELAALFAEAPGMSVLDTENRRRYNLPDDDGTGDILIALNEGSVVFPDFFRRQSAPLGMHGYADVQSLAGLPFLALESELSALIPSNRHPNHADVHMVMRRFLGLN